MTRLDAMIRPEDESKVGAMFDRVAPRYDMLNTLLSGSQDKRWRRHLVTQLPYRPGGKLLDVATGTGDVLIAAATLRREYEAFVGVDISKEMLVRAEAKAKVRLKKASSEFRLMSAEKLDFAADTFDAVTISFGLRNVVDKDKAIHEFARVLKPQGILLILEFFTPESSVLAKSFKFYFKYILPVIGGLLSDKSAYKYLPASVDFFYAPDQLRQVVRASGLVVEYEKNFLFGACRLVACRKS